MEYTSFIYTFCTFVNLMISITNDMFCVAGFIRESKMIMCEIFTIDIDMNLWDVLINNTEQLAGIKDE